MSAPPDLASALIPVLINKAYPEYDKDGYFYLDMWPISQQILVCRHPDLIAQFTQDPVTSLPKHDQMPFEFEPFTHGADLVTSNGRAWRTWRACFNPAFSYQNVQGYVGNMVEEYRVFRTKLMDAAAKGEVVRLDGLTMKLTVDIIGHAVL
jgi:cytochrome P450